MREHYNSQHDFVRQFRSFFPFPFDFPRSMSIAAFAGGNTAGASRRVRNARLSPPKNNTMAYRQPQTQQLASMSRFDAAAQYKAQVEEEYARLNAIYEAKRAREATGQDSRQQQDVRLHPDAKMDWGGHVIPANSKKHDTSHVSHNVHVSAENGWLMPSERAEMERKANRKKRFERDINFMGAEAEAEGLPLHTATYQQAPGIFSHDTAHWQTNYEAQQAGEQVGYGRKAKNGSGVRRVKPFYEKSLKGRRPGVEHDFGPLESSSTNYHTSGNAGNIISHDPEPVMSFAGGKGYRGSHNMLKNLGDSIAQKFIAEGKLPKEKQSFRTTSLNPLRFENHANTSMPGYTGKTRLIR